MGEGLSECPQNRFRPSDASELNSKMVKVDYQKVLEEEASNDGIIIHYHTKGAQWGRAALRSKRIFIPKPKSFRSFFTGLHELGHIMSGHHGGDRKLEYVWEFEAFRWALRFCRERDFPVPESIIIAERNIIAEKLRDEVESGTNHVDVSIVKFVKEGVDDPDVEFVKKYVSDDGRALFS